MRIPAHDLERLVVDEVLRFLRDGPAITKIFGPLHLTATAAQRLVSQGNALAAAWDHQAVQERLALLKQIIHRAVIDDHDLLIEVAHRGLVTTLPYSEEQGVHGCTQNLTRFDQRAEPLGPCP